LFGLVWFVVIEKQGKLVSLNHYRTILDVAHQKALQERPHNTHKVGFLEKECNAAMKKHSALSNFRHEQLKKILVISLAVVVCLL
jgi:hypothetical protein